MMCFCRHSRMISSTNSRVTGRLTGPTTTMRPAFLPWKAAHSGGLFCLVCPEDQVEELGFLGFDLLLLFLLRRLGLTPM